MALCQLIELPVSDGQVNIFVICLDTPDSSQNILDRDLGTGLASAIICVKKMVDQGEVDLVVICSGKEKTFMAGADIKIELEFIGTNGMLRSCTDCIELNSILCALETLSIPTIAVINGTILGGGLELALSCDYRVADREHCRQLGLPEVKIGVLPGGGGCFRLPYLIGLRRAISLIVSGQSIGAKKALQFGIVDALWSETQSHSKQFGYEYDWIEELLQCIKKRKIGKRKFEITQRNKEVNLSRKSVHLPQLSEESLRDEMPLSWVKSNKKIPVKYSAYSMRNLSFLSPFRHLYNYLLYVITVIQLWRKVKGRMPSPYIALQTVWQCYNATTVYDAVIYSATGFTKLCLTAESKSLMSLFLSARQLKKDALSYAAPQDSQREKMIDSTFVVVSLSGLQYASSFIQSLIYADMNVIVIMLGPEYSLKNKLRDLIGDHFNYAVKRGHMTQEEVNQKIVNKLTVWTSANVSVAEQGRDDCVLVNMVFQDELFPEVLALKNLIKKKVHILACLNACSFSLPEFLPIHLADPLRKNTLCIEICTREKSSKGSNDVYLAAKLVSGLGKTPVVTPLLSSVGWRLTLSHWSLVAELCTRWNVNPKSIDNALLEAGFSKGPIATMKQFDKDVLRYIINKISEVDCQPLKEYLGLDTAPKTILSINEPPSSIALFVIVNIVITSYEIISSKVAPSVDAVDFIAVSGLVQFPPTEGGPISYSRKRDQHGTRAIHTMLNVFPWNYPLNRMSDRLLKRVDQIPPRALEAESSLLTNKELYNIGPTRGLENSGSLIYPLPFHTFIIEFLSYMLILLGIFPLIVFSHDDSFMLLHCVISIVLGLFCLFYRFWLSPILVNRTMKRLKKECL